MSTPSGVERMVVEAAGAGLRLASGAIGLATSLALLPLRLALKAVLPAPDPLPDLVPAPEPEPRSRQPAEEPAPGAEIHVSEPWDGYDRMTAAQVIDRLRDADTALVAMVRLYEQRHKARKAVLHRTAPKP